VIVYFYNLSESSSSDDLKQFISVGNMIIDDIFILVILVVEDTRIRPVTHRTKSNFVSLVSNKIDPLKI
jgi:hypothetical protein